MFHLNLDLGSLQGMALELKARADALVQEAAQNLAAQVYGRIVEEAQAKLHSSRQQYLDALSLEEKSGEYVITLDKSAVWIDDGMEAHEMIDQLIFGGTVRPKASKHGSFYKIIPFQINKAPSGMTPSGLAIRAAAMSAMKKAGIPWGKIEKGPTGQPLTGTLHKLNVMNAPIKTQEGPGQGHGPIGDVRQGGGGAPFLQGLNIIQRKMGGRITTVGRQAMIWRVVSTIHKGSGRWRHPGTQGKKILDSAFEWAKQEWESKIKPEILSALSS